MLTARSGARIQVKKDAECSPMDQTRPITLAGAKEQVSSQATRRDLRVDSNSLLAVLG